jgi:xanthine dehydrogenase accessory factor
MTGDFFNSFNELLGRYTPCVLVTVVESSGSTPAKPGFKMIVNENGRLDGSVGGGASETFAVDYSLSMIKKNEKSAYIRLILENNNNNAKVDSSVKKDLLSQIDSSSKKDLASKNDLSLDSTCGGSLTLFFELFSNIQLNIFGAGHIGLNLVNLVKDPGYSICLFDKDEKKLKDISQLYSSHSNISFYCISNIIQSDPPEIKAFNCLKKQEKIDGFQDNPENTQQSTDLKDFLKPDSFVVIVTHGHQDDNVILNSILNLYLRQDFKFSYIGMIGSKSKVKAVLENLFNSYKKFFEDTTFLKEKLEALPLYSPIGLDIGGTSASEIAISIAGEIQAVRYKKDQNHLSIFKEIVKDLN